MNTRFARFDIAAAILLFSGCLIVYIRTLAPGLLNGDSAEFQTIAYTLGIAHPSGYPIYVLIGKIFTLLPIGEVAYRVNLLSAVAAAIAAALTYLIIRQFESDVAPAVFGALMLALVPRFWKFATIAEVYTLSAAVLASIFFCVLKWNETKNAVWIALAGMLGGVSLGIHLSVALTAPAIVIYIFISAAAEREPRYKAVTRHALLGAAAGLVIFLLAFLYIDHRNAPAGYYNSVILPSLSTWDMTPADFDSPTERLAYLFFPPQFSGSLFALPIHNVSARLKDFVSEHRLLSLLAFIGFVFSIASKDIAKRKKSLFLILVWLSSAAFAFTYDVFDYYAFYYPIFLSMGIFAGLGVHGAAKSISAWMKNPRLIPHTSWLLCGALLVLFAKDFHSAWQDKLPTGLDEWDRYGYQSPGAYKFKSEKIIEPLEDNAIVFTNWSKLYGLYYAAIVVHGKTGMDFHQTYPQEDAYRIADSLIDYIEANIDSRPVYFTMYPTPLADRYNITPAGADLFRIHRK